MAGVPRRDAGAAGRVRRAPEDRGDGVDGGELVLPPGVVRAAERGGRVAGGILLAMSRSEGNRQSGRSRINKQIESLREVAARAVVYCERGHKGNQRGDHFV